MQYMTFLSSCSYCCVANLLESYGVDMQDRELALRAELPWLFRREGEEFLAGAMMQAPADFNRALRPMGFRFSERAFRREEVPEALQKNVPCMVGLKTGPGKHAMVFLGREGTAWLFLNPHRRDDGQEDCLCLTREELCARLEDTCCLGKLQKAVPETKKADYAEAITALSDYRTALLDFCGRKWNREALLARRDGFLRPIALDIPAMLAIAGETELLRIWEPIPGQIFDLFLMARAIPAQHVQLSLLEQALERYMQVIKKRGLTQNDS